MCIRDRNSNENGIIWENDGLEEVGIRADNGKVVVRIDPKYFRPCEVDTLLGDPRKAAKDLGWKASTKLEDLVKEMIDEDTSIAKKELIIKNEGLTIYSPKETPPSLN